MSPAAALEFEVVGGFSTVGLTWSPASIAVDLERDVLLLGGRDGSIAEVSRRGLFLQTVVSAGLLEERYPPADRGLAVIPTLDLLYCAGGYPNTGLHKYTRTGERLRTIGIYGYQSFQGLVLEPRDPVGVLHMLNHSEIVSWTLDDTGDLHGIRYSYFLNLRRGDGPITGFVLLATEGYFLVSLQQAQILLVPVSNLSPRHGELIWLDVTDRIDLTPLGIGAIDDLAYDPVREHLYLTDSSQERVFELAFAPPAPFHRGDPDESGDVSMSDALFTFNFLFLDGSAPRCKDAGDSNNDGQIDVSDAIVLLNFLFLDGPAPPAPGPPSSPCGLDPDPQDPFSGLGCEDYGRC